jgi:hypothetical protein
MTVAHVRAVLFAKDLDRVAAFYIGALSFERASGDRDHAILRGGGFELIVHQIPKAIADTIVITDPPKRRTSGTLRLDYAIASVEQARKLARSLGGDVDEAPPPWAARDADFFFGYDPEGNQFGVSVRS